jgi:hypothetical protein
MYCRLRANCSNDVHLAALWAHQRLDAHGCLPTQLQLWLAAEMLIVSLYDIIQVCSSGTTQLFYNTGQHKRI